MAEDTAQIYKRQKRRKLLVIAGVILLLITAMGVGAGVRWWQSQSGPDDDVVLAPPLPEPATDAQELRIEGNMEAFDEKVQAALNDPSTDDETRYHLYIQQGHAFADRDDWEAAIGAYKEAEQLDPSLAVAEALARAYETIGDIENAIRYLEAAIERNPEDSPVYEADDAAFKERIRILEEQL